MPRTAGAAPDPVDVRVGQRIRDLRIQRGMNQTQLAKPLGLTFQQLQKYENATNRVSCSKLALIAQTLGVTPGYFFDPPAEGADDPAPFALPSRLIRALSNVPVRHLPVIADMAEALGEARG